MGSPLSVGKSQVSRRPALEVQILLQEPLTEGMQSDVVEDDGEIAVRMSTGNWYILRQDPGDGRAFILEGGFGDRYRLQTDKPVHFFRIARLFVYKPRSQEHCSPESEEEVSGMQSIWHATYLACDRLSSTIEDA